MSAISGLYHTDDRPADADEIRPIVDAQQYRGPDDVQIRLSGPVALGHCMLRVTPESLRENQPLESRDSRLLISADVRLDNRDELIASLETSKDATDPDLLLAAYSKWGQRCVEHLLGVFAFALWDRSQGTLFCATDHFGVKPFHYFQRGDLFLCATDAEALLTHDAVPATPDLPRIADMLFAPVPEEAERTYYADVSVLPPAHTMTVSSHGVRVSRYWALDPSKELRLRSDAEYGEAFRDHFERAVDCRLNSAFPVASMLSGGLDSSSVTSMAAQLYHARDGEPLRTYSAIYDAVPESDERAYIRSVVERYGVQPSYFPADGIGPLSSVSSLIGRFPGPVEAGNLYINYTLYNRAGDDGCRVVLSGFDGDTTVSHGRDYVRELRENGRYVKLIREVYATSKLLDEDWTSNVWSWMKGPVQQLPGVRTLRKIVRRRRGVPAASPRSTPLPPAEWERALSPELRKMVGEMDAPSRPFQSERHEHHHRLTRPLLSRTVRLLDACAAASRVETRYPFMDRRLIEFCLSVPPEQKMQRGWTRGILRRGMENVLPPDIQWRKRKARLQPGFSHALRTYDLGRIQDELSIHSAALDGFVSPAYVSEVFDKLKSGTSNSVEENMLFRITALSIWLDRL